MYHSQEDNGCSEAQDFSESYKQQITEQAAIYKKTDKRDLKDFEKKVNTAAADLCLKDVSLLKRRGELLEKARKKVADDGYVFKKGRSRSKVYGQPDSPSKPKRPKYDEEAREGRIEAIEEELKDISRLLAYKEKSISQAESARNYKLCEKLTEDLMALKSKRRDLEVEKRLFERKNKRARRRAIRKSRESESSDIDSGPMSSRSTTPSRSVTPFFVRSSSVASSSSFTNAQDLEQGTSQILPQLLSPPGVQDLEQVVSQPLSPASHDSHVTSPAGELHSDKSMSPSLSPCPVSYSEQVTKSHF